MNAPVKIACIQMLPMYRDKEKNLLKVENFVKEAIQNKANLLVFPEVFNVGSAGKSREEAYSIAEPIPSGMTTQKLIELAKENSVYICGTLVEQDGVDLYNTSVLVGPDGFIGKYRKLHLCENENFFFEPGDLGIPVFKTPIGKISLLICLDAYYPEAFRIAALQGADIVCVSFKGRDVHESRKLPEGSYTVIPALCMANALSNHIFVVGCNCVGDINGYVCAGQSIIANQWGAPVVPIASYSEETILYADVDLCDSRRKYISSTNSRLANRRIDVYDLMLGYEKDKYTNK